MTTAISKLKGDGTVMLIIFIYGLPDDFCQEENLKSRLMRIIGEIEELKLSPADLSIIFPKDRLRPIEGLGEEIIIYVKEVLEKSERTAEARNNLSDKLVRAVSDFFPYSTIKCFFEPFDSESGYAILKPKQVSGTAM